MTSNLGGYSSLPERLKRSEEQSEDFLLLFQQSCLIEMDFCPNEGAAIPLLPPVLRLCSLIVTGQH